jgi:endonuclease YncB( thermonuclease family)
LLVPLLAFAQHAPPAQPFQRLDGCVYKSERWNDGDSFHVLLRDQKEVIFRLYFVDTPEEERVYADRIAEQAAYFGISADAARKNPQTVENDRRKCVRLWNTSQSGEVAGCLLSTGLIPQGAQDSGRLWQ